MGKYSSDSDSEKRGGKCAYKNRNRHRSSSSSSPESSTRRRKRKSEKRKTRSKSRERFSRSRRSRSSSSAYKSSKSRRRSRSKDRSRYKRSRSRDRHRSRSKSRTRHRRSRSKSYIREYTSKPRRHSTSSSSSDSSDQSKNTSKTNVRNQLETQKKSPEMTKVDLNVYNEINEDSFAQKAFSSSKSKKLLDNIVIDLKKQTIKVPEVEPVEPDSIFHHNLFLNEEARMEKWIKELYAYRQKALQQGLKVSDK